MVWYILVTLLISFRIFTWEIIDPSLSTYLKPVHLLNVLTTVAFICGLLGGIWSRPSESRITDGFRLRRAGDILFIVAVVAILLLAIYMRSRSVASEQRHDPAFTQIFFVLPLMLTRIIYATIQAFLSTPQNPGHNTWVYLALLLIPDLLSDAIYTFYGVFLLRTTEAADVAKRSANTEYSPPMNIQRQSEYPLQSFAWETPAYQPTYEQQSYQRNHQGQAQQLNYGRRLKERRRRRGPLHMLVNAVMDHWK